MGEETSGGEATERAFFLLDSLGDVTPTFTADLALSVFLPNFFSRTLSTLDILERTLLLSLLVCFRCLSLVPKLDITS